MGVDYFLNKLWDPCSLYCLMVCLLFIIFPDRISFVFTVGFFYPKPAWLEMTLLQSQLNLYSIISRYVDISTTIIRCVFCPFSLLSSCICYNIKVSFLYTQAINLMNLMCVSTYRFQILNNSLIITTVYWRLNFSI